MFLAELLWMVVPRPRKQSAQPMSVASSWLARLGRLLSAPSRASKGQARKSHLFACEMAQCCLSYLMMLLFILLKYILSFFSFLQIGFVFICLVSDFDIVASSSIWQSLSACSSIKRRLGKSGVEVWCPQWAAVDCGIHWYCLFMGGILLHLTFFFFGW